MALNLGFFQLVKIVSAQQSAPAILHEAPILGTTPIRLTVLARHGRRKPWKPLPNLGFTGAFQDAPGTITLPRPGQYRFLVRFVRQQVLYCFNSHVITLVKDS